LVDIEMKRKSSGFEIAISGRRDGSIEAIYLAVSGNKIARTDEIIEDHMLVDYDRNGRMVGVEILAPVRLRDVTGLGDVRSRAPLKRFLCRSVPQEFVSS
jgi:uncharacterized protein YuzE